MNRIIALIATSFALSACATNPTGVGPVPENAQDDGISATEVQANADDPGLGAVVYDNKIRAQPCKKRRKTGSHQYITTCDDPDGGSRPVRQGDWNSLGRYVVTGGGPN